MNEAIFPRLPVTHESASNAQAVSSILRHVISVHAKELMDAKAMIDGNLVSCAVTLSLLE